MLAPFSMDFRTDGLIFDGIDAVWTSPKIPLKISARFPPDRSDSQPGRDLTPKTSEGHIFTQYGTVFN